MAAVSCQVVFLKRLVGKMCIRDRLGPLLGPVLGGWLTENISWQWCFFINLPVAIALISLLLLGMPHEKSNLHELPHADWLGIIGMSVGLSSLTIVLEEGQRDQWFESTLITVSYTHLDQAQLEAKRANLALQKTTLKRQEELFNGHGITEQAFDDIRAKTAIAAADADVALSLIHI